MTKPICHQDSEIPSAGAPTLKDVLQFLDSDIVLAQGLAEVEHDDGSGRRAVALLMEARRLVAAHLSAPNSDLYSPNGSLWQSGLPDSDMTVLIRCANEEHPLWPGFHDGECWRTADAAPVEGAVLGWMELEGAAKLLDGRKA